MVGENEVGRVEFSDGHVVLSHHEARNEYPKTLILLMSDDQPYSATAVSILTEAELSDLIRILETRRGTLA